MGDGGGSGLPSLSLILSTGLTLLWGAVLQGTCAADLYRHPQLDADIEAVKEIYSENAVAVRWVHRCLHPGMPSTGTQQ